MDIIYMDMDKNKEQELLTVPHLVFPYFHVRSVFSVEVVDISGYPCSEMIPIIAYWNSND